MSLAVDDYPTGKTPANRHDVFWALVDASLLCAVLITSSDMLLQLGGGLQSIVWLYCYGMTLLRILLMWPYFLPVLMRNRVIMIYPAICITSVLWSITKAYSLTASIQLSMTMLIAVYLGWRYSMTVLVKTIAVVMSIAVFLSLLHWATGIFPWPVYMKAGGLAGLFSSKSMLGFRCIFAATALLSILLMYRHEAGPLFRGLSILALFGCIFTLALSQSITAVLTLPIMLSLLFVLCWRRIPPILVVAAIFVGLAAVSIGPALLAIAGINPIEALLGAVGKSSTLTGRVYIWAVAIDVYADHPILGVGYRAFWRSPQFLNEQLIIHGAGATTSKSFHQFALEILVSVGWPGLIAMLTLLWASTARMLKVFMLTGSVAMAGGVSMMVGIIMASMVTPSLYRGHEVMIILVVAFAVSAGEDLYRMRRQALKNEAEA